MMKRISFLLMAQAGLAQANPEILTVGMEPNCDHTSIQAAIDAAESGDYVAITTTQTYRELLAVSDKDLGLFGGFATCNDAVNGNVSDDLTTVSGDLDDDGTGEGSVLTLTGSGRVEVYGLKITEGGTLQQQGGGMSIEKSSGTVAIQNTVLTQNRSGSGGGLALSNSPGVELELQENVYIVSNHAIFGGGGLYCDGTATIVMEDDVENAGIINNTSNLSGGGIYLDNGCEMTFKSGRIESSLFDFRGITRNSADLNGGGAAVINGSKLYLTPPAGQTVNVSENTADANANGSGVGGGVYVAGAGSVVQANNSILSKNKALIGGGAYVASAGDFHWLSLNKDCVDRTRCAQIKGNEAEQLGGGVYVKDDESEVVLLRAAVEYNRANFGTGVYADSEAVVRVDYSLFTHNGDNGNNGFFDVGVVQAHNNAWLNIKHATFANNKAETGVFITGITPFSINLYNSIVHDASSGLVVDLSEQQQDNLLVFCAMFHEDGGLYGNDFVVADPHFYDSQAGDYRIDGLQSQAVDACFNLSEYDHDYAGVVAGWDDPNVIDNGSTFDMGAYESYDGDVIFKNNFED